MVVVNFKIVMEATENGPAWLVRLVGLIDGRAAATFVVLAGVGLSLLSRNGRESADSGLLAENRNTLLRRALFLFVVGLLYTEIWPADILHFYGVYIGVASFLLTTSAFRLRVITGALVLGFVAMLVALNYDQGWDWNTLEYEGFWTLLGMARHILFNGFHPVVPWLAFMLVGMLIGRLDMGAPSVRRRVFLTGVSVAVTAEFISWFLLRTLAPEDSLTEEEGLAAILGSGPMPPLPLYMLAGGGTASALIAASVALGERCRDSAWLRPLIATGQLALTLYVAHVLIGMGTLEVTGRLYDQTLPFSLLASFVFCVGSVAFASLWRSRFERGPLEAIMRFLTEPRRRAS